MEPIGIIAQSVYLTLINYTLLKVQELIPKVGILIQGCIVNLQAVSSLNYASAF